MEDSVDHEDSEPSLVSKPLFSGWVHHVIFSYYFFPSMPFFPTLLVECCIIRLIVEAYLVGFELMPHRYQQCYDFKSTLYQKCVKL